MSMGGRAPVLSLLTVVAIAACGFAGNATAAGHPTRLTVAVGVDPETLDPAQVSTGAAAQVVRMAVEPLVALDQQGRVQPLLATRWDVAPDGAAYTFTLRAGVKFSDGEPLDAAAVEVSLDRLLDRRMVRAQPGTLKVIQAVRAIDATHVAVTLKNPYPALPQALAGVQAGIVAPKSISASRLTPPQLLRLVGTGPFVLSDRLIGRRLTLVRNATYWGPRPAYAEQLFEVVPDAAAREAMAAAGRADVTLVPSRDLPALQNHPDLRVIRSGSDDAVVTASRVRGVSELSDGQVVTAGAAPA
jgi:peptide/nickel transport system substrate-binding protein